MVFGEKNGFQISGWSVTLNIFFWDLKEYTDKKSESNSGLKGSKTTQKVKKTILKGFLGKKNGFQISGWSLTCYISFWDVKEYTDKKSD